LKVALAKDFEEKEKAMKDALRWILEDCENLTLGVLLLSAMIIFSIVTASSIIVLFIRLLSGV